MADFKSFESLAAAANRSCRQIMDKDLAPAIKQMLKEHIQSDIYEANPPPKPGAWVGGGTYVRRHMAEKKILHSFFESSGESGWMLVTSYAGPSKAILTGYHVYNNRSGALFRLLENNWRGFLRRKRKPAMVIPNVQRELATDARVSEAIKRGLRKHFSDVSEL